MNNFPILYFRLEGPLQSWGERSKWDLRDTASFPSKSGVIGLLASAMGLERDDPEIVNICTASEIAVRADRQGSYLTDFHSVMGNPIMTAKGESRGKKDTIISRRAYLQDASFTICVHSDYDILQRMKDALDKPRWVLYLGRKCCVPSVPIQGKITEEYSSLEEAIQLIPLSNRHDKVILYQCESADQVGEIRMDEIVDSAKRFFAGRTVCSRVLERKDENVHQ